MKEDDLKRLRKKFNARSAIFALVIMVIAGLSNELVSWFFQLMVTLVAAALAGSIGLYLYSRQLTERRQHFHTLLVTYLDYLMESTPTEPKVGRVDISFVNTQILNQVIVEEKDEALVRELVRLQGLIETYSTLTATTIQRTFEENHKDKSEAKKESSTTTFEQIGYILSTARMMVVQARKCKQMVQRIEQDVEPVASGLPRLEVLAKIGERDEKKGKAPLGWLYQQLSKPDSNFDKLDLYGMVETMVREHLVESYTTSRSDRAYGLAPGGRHLLEEARKTTEEGKE